MGKQRAGFGDPSNPGHNIDENPQRIATQEWTICRTLLRNPGADQVTVYFADSFKNNGTPSASPAWTFDNRVFANCCTPWESQYSTLIKRETPGMVNSYTFYHPDPVVDNDLTIVGHYGLFKGDEIWVPKSVRRSIGLGELSYAFHLKDLVEQGVPVLIRKPFDPPPDADVWGADEELYRLATDVNGRVLYYEGHELVGIESAESTLMVITLMVSLIRVAGTALQVGIKSLIRQFAKGAPKILDRPKLPPGIINGDPPGVGFGKFAQPGSLFGQVEITGGKVVYKVKAIILTGAKTEEEEAAVRVARLAHREMIVRSAKAAQLAGKKTFTMLGKDANANFRAHADKLAEFFGIPRSGLKTPTMGGFSDYEVILDVAKVIGSQ